MTNNELRYYQLEALEAMHAMPDGEVGCVTMACGTGKTLIVKTFIVESGPGLTIVIFPRLALIEQYTRCYGGAGVMYITVGSLGFSARADKNKIRRLINQGHENDMPVVLLTTYISIIPLADTLDGYEVDTMIYDESHHTNTQLQDDALSIINPNRVFYFTATPVSNHINIIYKYSYEQALADEVSRQFIVSIYVTAQPKSPEAIYEMLGYFARKYGVRNTICYHQYSNIPGDDEEGSSVNDHLDFVGVDTTVAEPDGEEDWNGEAPDEHETLLPPGSEVFCFQGKTPIPERVRILDHIKKEDCYSVIHSCETVAEGVDTQEIDSVCPIDEIKDIVRMTQILGRVMRKSRVYPDRPSYIFIPFFNCEGRGREGQNINSIQVHTDTSLKGRSKKTAATAKAEEAAAMPRHYYIPNETEEIDLEKIDGNGSVNLISGIMSFLARDKGDRGGVVDFEVEEMHKRTDNFTIEAVKNDGTTTMHVGINGHRGLENGNRDNRREPPPQIELYGTNKPRNAEQTDLEIMIETAEKAVADHQDNLETARGLPMWRPNVDTPGYYFVDFIASVIRTGDPRYKRHPEVEEILEEAFGVNWEFGLYTPQRIDERIMDIINNKRFGQPKLIPDAFNTKWRGERNKLGSDVTFVTAWKSRR